MSLLCHAFAATDDIVIAVMIVPLQPVTNNTTLKLSRADRKVLWQHDVLGRFAWVFQDPTLCTGDRRLTRNDEHNRVSRLIRDMKRQAKRDGYNLSFYSLIGSDYLGTDQGCKDPWFRADGTISSGVSRLRPLMSAGNRTPVNLRRCQPWNEKTGLRGVPPGGLVWKLVSKASQAGSVSITETPRLPEQLQEVFSEGDSTLWICSSDEGTSTIFISSRRKYDRDILREDLSATIVRSMLGSTPGWDLLNKLPSVIINPEALVSMLARVLTQERDPLTLCGDTCIFHRPQIPKVQKPSVITKAWSKIVLRRRKSTTAAEKGDVNASDDDASSDGVVEPQMRKITTFQMTPDTDSPLIAAHSERVDRLKSFTIAEPEPAELHGPKIEVDEYAVETTYVPLLNADGIVVDYVMKRTSSVKAVRNLKMDL